MKNDNKKRDLEYWFALSDKYFNALTTNDEEKALADFLASDAANHPTFNEIKAVMGYLSTGRSIAQKGRKKNHDRPIVIGKAIQWASIAACATAIAVIGTSIGQHKTLNDTDGKDTYYAYIDGKEYTDEDAVMKYMLSTMNKMSTTSNNVIEEQMEAMFKIGY